VLYVALLPLPDEVMRTSFPFTRAALAGGLTWLLWHRRGWLHTTAQPPSLWVILGQLVCGALVGLTAHYFTRHDRTYDDLRMVEDWLNAGYYDRAVWLQLALYCVGRHAWGGLLAATLACFLGQPGTSLRARLRSVTPALLLLVTTGAAARIYVDRVWQGVYQFRTPLPEVLGLSGPWRPERRVVLLADQADAPMPFRLSVGQSWVQLPTSPSTSCAPHLQAQTGGPRREAVGFPWHEARTAVTAGALQVARQQLASPSSTPIFGACLVEALQRLPYSAGAAAAMDELLAGQQWAYPSREARDEVLQLAWRFGRLQDYRPLLRPEQQARFDALLKDTPPGRGNRVAGRLLLAGKPLAEVQVGLVRAEDWGVFYRDSRLPLTAWEQRLVIASATTTADGGFSFPELFDGDYRLLLRIRPRLMPRSGGMMLHGFGGTLELAGGHRRELGTIELQPWTLPAQAEEVSGAGTRPARRAL